MRISHKTLYTSWGHEWGGERDAQSPRKMARRGEKWNGSRQGKKHEKEREWLARGGGGGGNRRGRKVRDKAPETFTNKRAQTGPQKVRD